MAWLAASRLVAKHARRLVTSTGIHLVTSTGIHLVTSMDKHPRVTSTDNQARQEACDIHGQTSTDNQAFQLQPPAMLQPLASDSTPISSRSLHIALLREQCSGAWASSKLPWTTSKTAMDNFPTTR